jgi:hypothetical protein
MSKTPRAKGSTDPKTDMTRPAGPPGNVDGSATVMRTNAGTGREDGALVRIALRFTTWGRFRIRVISGHKPRDAETRHVVQQGSPLRTLKSFFYLVENTRLIGNHRRSHFRTAW